MKNYSEVPGQQFKSNLTKWIFIFSVIFIGAVQVAQAQVLYGSLTGNVNDSNGAAIGGAKVEVTNINTGANRSATSDERGGYLFSDLQPGVYKVIVSQAGFKTAINETVNVVANSTYRYDPTLEVGDVKETVTISQTDIPLQVDRADVNVVLPSRQVNDLPLTGSSGRNYQSLLTIVPGAAKDLSQQGVSNGAGEANSAAGNPQRSISFNINGVSRLQNNTRIDGAAVLYPWLPTNTAYVPIAESIQEVNIVTNSYDAEQGLVGGAFVNVITKSGGNSFHGSGWGYMLNSSIGKARNYFLTTPGIPKDVLAQYGFTVGGPIVKNKLFFFADLERTTRNNLSRVNTVSIAPASLRPTGTGVDFTGTGTTIFDPASNVDPRLRTPFAGNIIPLNRLSAAAIEMIKLMPLPTGSGFTNNFTAQGVATFKRTNYDTKINYNATDKLQLWGRYSYSPTLIFEDPILGAAGGDALNGGQLGTAPGKVYVFSAGGNYSFSSNFAMDAVYGQTLQNLGAEFDLDRNFGLDVLHIPGTNGPDRLQGGIPSFQITGWANLGNPNTGNPFKFHDKQFTLADNFSWTKGSHGIRFGLDYQKQRINHFQPQGADFQTVRGTFRFNGNPTALQSCSANSPTVPSVCATPGTNPTPAAANSFNAWASFLLGLPSTAGKVDQLRNPNAVYFTSYAIYARDHYQVNRDLTVTYGARYERYMRPDKDSTGINWFDPGTGNIYTGGLTGVPRNSYMTSGSGWLLPRLGVAYRVGENMVIRGGYGVSTDPRPFIDFRNAYPIVNVWQMPLIRLNNIDNGFIPVTNLVTGLVNSSLPPDLTAGILRLPANAGTTTYPRRPDRELIHSYNVIVERELPWKFRGSVGYVGTKAKGQMGFININASAPGTGTGGRPLFQLYGYTQDINEIKPYGDTTYDSMQVTLIRRYAGTTMGAAYTWSKTINYADNDANPRIQYLPEKERNKGLAGYDRTHNLQLYGVMDLPFGRGKEWAKSGVLGKVLEGFQVNTIISMMSGTPFSIVQGTAPNLQAGGSGQYPNQLIQNIAILHGIGVGNPYFDRTVLGINCSSNCAWMPETGARFGNAGRNNLRGPAYFNVDLGVFKTIGITERLKLQLRGEALNLLNRANFGNPQGDINNANFGYVTSTVGIGERNLRFAARIIF